MTRIALVAAVAENGVIGSAGALPWRISDDLKWFKRATTGKPVIMGRKTYESIGEPLPGRDNIVVTRDENFQPEGVIIARNLETALARAHDCADARGVEEVCVIGGGEIYAQTIDAATRIYLTRVKAHVAGESSFPALKAAEWRETAAGECLKSERNQYACEFVILDRVVPAGRTPPN